MEFKKKAMFIVAIVAVSVLASSFAYELVVSSGWNAQELGYTQVEDGYYQLAWNSKGVLQLAYIGIYGPYYALLHGERIDGKWNITYVSRLFYDHQGASMALDSHDNVYVCTSSYRPTMNVIGSHILLASNSGGKWDAELFNMSYTSSAEVAVDAQDRVHVLYTRDTHQSVEHHNSTLVDMVKTEGGWNRTVLKEVLTPYVFYEIVDVDRRPDGTIGMIYQTYNLQVGWTDVTWSRLNYSILSNDGLIVDSTVIPSMANYTGTSSLCHDAAGNAYISAFRKIGEVYSVCYFTNSGGSWTSTDVAFAGNGAWWRPGSSIRVASDGSIHMGYFTFYHDENVTNHTVRYCTNSGGLWKVRILDDCTGWPMEEHIAITTDEDQDLHLVYFQSDVTDKGGERDVTVYTTSESNPILSAANVSIWRAAVSGLIALVIVLLVLRRRRLMERQKEWSEKTGLFEDRGSDLSRTLLKK